ncbi:hypothetical protein Fcan01_16025 [Folsomia candida]|uniref:Uncharacterized protein n=1 Tax=Folsomia candida TaxID=158441 RepID=A0A226DWZ9_FOLCA|nr:hypothetical protein Fcan01_16025 [Folsomia candida]
MITQIFKSYRVNYIKISCFLWCSPVFWNSARSKIEFVREKKRKNVVHVQRIIFTLYVMGMVRNVISGDASTDVKFQSMAMIPTFVSVMFTMWIWGLDISPSQFFNSLSKFELYLIKDYGQVIFWKRLSSSRISTQGMVLVCQILSVTLIVCPFLAFGFVVANPCQPQFLGSMTSLCIEGAWWPTSLVGKHLRKKLCILSKHMKLIRFRHLTRSPSPRLRLMPCIRLYRKIWIVERMLNAIFSAALVPIMLLNCTSVQIFAGFVTISRHSVVQMPQYLMFPIVWWNCIAMAIRAGLWDSWGS